MEISFSACSIFFIFINYAPLSSSGGNHGDGPAAVIVGPVFLRRDYVEAFPGTGSGGSWVGQDNKSSSDESIIVRIAVLLIEVSLPKFKCIDRDLRDRWHYYAIAGNRPLLSFTLLCSRY